MKLVQSSSHRSVHDMFRLILIIYNKIMKKTCQKLSRIIQRIHICKFEKNRFLQDVQKIELVNRKGFGFFDNALRKLPSKMYSHGNILP